jgi:hypothetical protein
VIRILTGPAIGIEKINPAKSPAIDMVKMLSNKKCFHPENTKIKVVI